MNGYPQFGVFETADSAYPVIQGYGLATPLPLPMHGHHLDKVRDGLREELKLRATGEPSKKRSAARYALTRFGELYGAPVAPGDVLSSMRAQLLELFATYRRTGVGTLYVADDLTVALDHEGARGQIYFVSSPDSGIRLSFLPQDVKTIESYLVAAGFRGPFTCWATCSNVMTVRVPAEQLPEPEECLATPWFHSRSP